MSGMPFWQASFHQQLTTLEARFWLPEPVSLWASIEVGLLSWEQVPSSADHVCLTILWKAQICFFYPPKRCRIMCPQSFLWENMKMYPITELQSVRHPNIASCSIKNHIEHHKITKCHQKTQKRSKVRNIKKTLKWPSKYVFSVRIFTGIYGVFTVFYGLVKYGV